ncbi:MAG: hypothetical protein HY300_12635 [Verrucomicrobia bacterium]|nr:hypothetical protein [Verrucomicrobiota bacterium]
METQTPFDLNRSLEQWRGQLAHSPAIKRDNLAELEVHLRDSIAGLQAKGLSEEEAFVIAAKRIGQPVQITAEFGKVNMAAVWLNRLQWIVVGGFSFSVATIVVSSARQLTVPINRLTGHAWLKGFYPAVWLVTLLVIGVWFAFARWLMSREFRRPRFLNSPIQLITGLAICCGLIRLWPLLVDFAIIKYFAQPGVYVGRTANLWMVFAQQMFFEVALPLCLLAAWKIRYGRQ